MFLLNDWSESTPIDIFREFDVPPIEDVEILLASYSRDNYEGDAFVLFKQKGKLWEVNGSHCSCFELEGQWDPEETTVESLRHRMLEGTLGNYEYAGNIFKTELEQVLNQLEKE